MVKYYCNKCGTNITSKMLRIQTADAAGEKQNYHLCYNCTMMFNDFMKLNPLMEDAEEITEEQKDIVAERVANISDPKLGDLIPAHQDLDKKERTLEQIVSDTVKETVGREHVKESPDDTVKSGKVVKENEVSTDKQKSTGENDAKPRAGRNVKYITPENREFIEKHAFDMSTSDIAKHLGIPYPSVYQCVNVIKRSKGEVSVKGTPSISDSEAGKIVALKRAGWSVKDIAGDMGHEISEVEEVLKNVGL